MEGVGWGDGAGGGVVDVRRAVRDSLAGLGPGALVLAACSGGPDSTASRSSRSPERHLATRWCRSSGSRVIRRWGAGLS